MQAMLLHPDPPAPRGHPRLETPFDVPPSSDTGEHVPAAAQPYGAFELKAVARTYLARASYLASVLWCVGFITTLGATHLVRHAPVERTIVLVPYRELSAPPPLQALEAPPQISVAPTAASPAVGIAVPVPDAQAPAEQTIASQQEIAAMTPGVETPSGTDQIVVSPPDQEELPRFGEYVFVEELPEAVTRVTPVYPDIAREANVDGTVLVQALVGKDGRVRDVRIAQSIPMLDEAAATAVRQWVFKPALSNNRPVAVWVAVPVVFRLRSS